nr:MAG TPA: hypothetical protein [Caudoviricetes sp.]
MILSSWAPKIAKSPNEVPLPLVVNIFHIILLWG